MLHGKEAAEWPQLEVTRPVLDGTGQSLCDIWTFLPAESRDEGSAASVTLAFVAYIIYFTVFSSAGS